MAALVAHRLPTVSLPWRRIASVLRWALGSFVLFLVLGNLVITLAWQLHRAAVELVQPSIDGVAKLSVVDEHVWRSAAPSARAYDLADAGVRTIVDLRAEEDLVVDTAAMRAVGIQYEHLPMRDGQSPSPVQVERLLATIDSSDGITLVHCGAGVGRTGAMVAAYRVTSGQASGAEAMRFNLAVGPPSLEQLAFAASLDDGVHRPPAIVVGASRVLDAPRRLWSRYGL